MKHGSIFEENLYLKSSEKVNCSNKKKYLKRDT